jgi:alginate O-acetyltransferase complex protein AlgJ
MRHKFQLRHIEQLPVFVLFIALFLPLLLSLVNLLGEPGRKWLAALNGSQLSETTTVIKFTEANWWSGSLNKQIEVWINEQIPLRPPVVRATNQLYYSLFSKSYMAGDSLIVGKNEFLFEAAYIEKYCNNIAWKHKVHTALTEIEVEQWSRQIQDISGFFQKRGQTFLYVITPSKATYYPEYIPSQFRCAPTKPRSEYYAVIAALNKINVPYVDTTKVILEGKGQHLVDLFTRGGIHWNDLGVALGTREIIAKAAKVSGKNLPSLEFSYNVDRNPVGIDADLLYLANLKHPNLDYPVPKVALKAVPQSELRLAVVGGSFVNQILETLQKTNHFCRVDHYYYFSISHRFSPGQGICAGEDPPNSYQRILDANIVILEENEEKFRSKHSDLLLEFISKQSNPISK